MNDFKIGELTAGLAALKEAMATHNSITMSKLDRILDMNAVIDKKADKAHSRIDDLVNEKNGTLIQIKMIAEEALKYGTDYHENKKKAIFGAGLLVSLGAFIKWAITGIF